MNNEELCDSSDEEAQFYVTFTQESIETVKTLSNTIYKHVSMWDQIRSFQPLINNVFVTLIEQKLAMFIAINNNANQKFVIYKEDVIKSFKLIIINLIYLGCNNFLYDVPNTYEISILTKIFNCKHIYVHILIESIKIFIKIRKYHPKWIPLELNDVAENNIYVDNDKCPINKIELDILYRTLNSRKYIYVKILLGSLYEMKHHMKILFESNNISCENILEVCNSSWLSLFLLGSDIDNINLYHPIIAPTLSEFIKKN